MESAVPNPEIEIHSDNGKAVFIGHFYGRGSQACYKGIHTLDWMARSKR